MRLSDVVFKGLIAGRWSFFDGFVVWGVGRAVMGGIGFFFVFFGFWLFGVGVFY